LAPATAPPPAPKASRTPGTRHGPRCQRGCTGEPTQAA
jgi:hypothetical protein